MLRFGPRFFFHVLSQRFSAQHLRRQPEMDMVMLDEEQDQEYALDGELGSLAIIYELIISSVTRVSPHEGQALDIASGSGQLLAKLAVSLPKMQFRGTDISEHMLEIGRKSAKTYGATNLSFERRSMYELEALAPRQFDLITWSLALHHCHRSRDVERVLAGAHRLLKPGGTFFLFDIIRPKTGASAVALADLYNRGRGSWFYHDSLDSYKAAFTFGELAEILARSPFTGIRHVQPRVANFFQMAYASHTHQRGPRPRSFLRRFSQRVDYAMLRLGFAGMIR